MQSTNTASMLCFRVCKRPCSLLLSKMRLFSVLAVAAQHATFTKPRESDAGAMAKLKTEARSDAGAMAKLKTEASTGTLPGCASELHHG